MTNKHVFVKVSIASFLVLPVMVAMVASLVAGPATVAAATSASQMATNPCPTASNTDEVLLNSQSESGTRYTFPAGKAAGEYYVTVFSPTSGADYSGYTWRNNVGQNTSSYRVHGANFNVVDSQPLVWVPDTNPTTAPLGGKRLSNASYVFGGTPIDVSAGVQNANANAANNARYLTTKVNLSSGDYLTFVAESIQGIPQGFASDSGNVHIYICPVAQAAAITCSNNSQCGTNGYVNSPICTNGNVFQDYKTYTCNNPGTASSTCTNTIVSQQKTVCGSNQTCSGGSCVNQNVNIACNTNSDCGSNGYTGSPTCNGNSIYRNYTTYTCNNPGTANAYCAPAVTNSQFISNCSYNQTCQAGSCVNNTVTTCTNNSYQQCKNGSVHWFDSCGTDQGVSQACTGNQTCSGNVCVNQTVNNYVYHASQRCVGSSTVYWFDSNNSQQDIAQTCSNNQICQGNTCVNQNQTGSLQVTETVRNLSTGNLNYSNSVSAAPGDILQYNIAITSIGNLYVNNVTVKNTLPANLIYNNNLTVDGSPTSGNIVSGINIGSVNPGQTRTVTYQVQVAGVANFPFGTTTLTDATYVSSTDPNVNPTSASSQVIVTRGGVLGATDVSTGLTNNILFDSFFIPLLIALMGVWLVKSGYVAMPAWAGKFQAKNKEAVARKQLEAHIAKIKNGQTGN